MKETVTIIRQAFEGVKLEYDGAQSPVTVAGWRRQGLTIVATRERQDSDLLGNAWSARA